MLKRAIDCEAEWEHASDLIEKGRYKQAVIIFTKCAKLEHAPSQVSLGYYYDHGLGVPKNENTALFWYKKAYRSGGCTEKGMAASNIATTYRDWGNYKRALFWYRRAVNLKPYPNEDARYDIAKIYAKNPRNRKKALHELRILLEEADPKLMTELTQERAQELFYMLKSWPRAFLDDPTRF